MSEKTLQERVDAARRRRNRLFTRSLDALRSGPPKYAADCRREFERAKEFEDELRRQLEAEAAKAKRSPMARRAPTSRAATKQPRVRREPWRPDPVGAAFNRWSCRVVKARSKSCQHCFLQVGTDCAHVFRLGAGASRYDWRDWRNWPAARVLLCREDHRGLDELQSWRYSEAAMQEMAREAQVEMAAGVERWDRKAAA